MKKILRNQSGVALMMVLSSILILTTIVVEFAYNSHVNYELAAAERDRLKAYYLAYSGINLIRLELRVERQIRSQFANVLKDVPGINTADPLCKQIPLSSGLLSGGVAALMAGAEGDSEGGDTGAETPPPPEKTDAAEGEGDGEGFGDLDGSFEVTCDGEESKININAFHPTPAGTTVTTPANPTNATNESADAASPSPANPPPSTLSPNAQALYEAQKALLFSLMTGDSFESIFGGKPDEARKVVNAIADWADANDRIDEAPGVEGGSEDSEYSGPEYTYKVKNGKYASVAELLLVSGVGDDIYNKLAPHVTVYGDTRINLCQSSEEIAKAFILRFIQLSPGLAPIASGDEARWTTILEGIHTACTEGTPQPATIAQSILSAVGGMGTGGAAASLASLITTSNRFYRIESTGSSGETNVRIVSVVDTGSNNPNQWKTLYFRVE